MVLLSNMTNINHMTELWSFVPCPNCVEPPKSVSYLNMTCILFNIAKKDFAKSFVFCRVQPSKKLRLRWLVFSSHKYPMLHLMIRWENQTLPSSLRCHTALFTAHRTMAWCLLGEEPHPNQLHFYHHVTNTTTTSVEIFILYYNITYVP